MNVFGMAATALVIIFVIMMSANYVNKLDEPKTINNHVYLKKQNEWIHDVKCPCCQNNGE